MSITSHVRVTRIAPFLLVLGPLAAVPRMADAQDTTVITDEGFQPNRDYLTPTPFERIDTLSGNVVLTFTDLELPGNAGRVLRFQRTYNSQRGDAARNQWSFGIAGLPLRVRAGAIPPAGTVPNDLRSIWLVTPRIDMSDGSVHRTAYQSDATRHEVFTHAFWKYNWLSRHLFVPDGTVCEYTTNGLLWSAVDPFGNTLLLDWGTPGSLVVRQVLGNGQERVITFEMDHATLLPTRMTYENRTWIYTYDTPDQLRRVDQPEDPDWEFEYGTAGGELGRLVRVRTPHGGVIDYTYAEQNFRVGPEPTDLDSQTVLTDRDTSGNVPAGNWHLEYAIGPVGGIGQAVLTTPSGTRVTYDYDWIYTTGTGIVDILAGGFALVSRRVEVGDTPLETETRTYTPIPAIRSIWGTPEVTIRTITRPPRTYTTEYTYNAAVNFGNYHHPSQISETGDLSRTTNPTYAPAQTSYILGLVQREDVTVGTETFTKEWMYDGVTGFRTSEILYGITTTFTKDDFGNVASVRKANNKTTSFTYSWGQVQTTQTETPMYTVSRSIRPDGAVESETRANRTTRYFYDGLGRLTRTEPPGGEALSLPIVTTYVPGGTSVETTRGTSKLTTTLDGFGRPIATKNADGVDVRTRTEYDAEGRIIYQSYPFTGTADIGTRISYDGLGRVTRRTNPPDPDGTFTALTYGPGTVTIRDENGRETRQTWQAFGHPDDARLTQLIDAAGKTWSYGYDALGNLTSVTADDGSTREWVYDTRNLLTSETHPESGQTLYPLYDAAGVLKRKVDANNAEFVYGHDNNDRVTSITSGTHVTTIGYEPGSDNRASMKNGSVSTTFEYDPAGRLAHRRDIIGAYVFDSRYTYDGNDQVIAITYPTQRVIEYDRNDPERRIMKVFETAAGRDYAFGMSYHPSGALERYTAGNTLPTVITYDPQRYSVQSITTGPRQLTYGPYDGVGNVLGIGDSRGWTQTFTYDALHRLESATGPYGSSTYIYDAHGNRQSNASGTYVYDANTLRLMSQNGQAFGYDNNGNLTSTPTATFTYTPDNWLATATTGGTQTTYAYDADGWRTKKTIPGEKIFYLRGPSGELLTEWHDLGATGRARDYVYAGSRLLSAVDKPVAPMTACGGESIPDGSPTSLSIASEQTGTVAFEGSACRRVSAVITASTLSNCSVFYNKFRIFKPDGGMLAEYTGVCAGSIVGPADLPVSGTSTVVVDPYGTNAGTVTVNIYDVVDVTGPITFGQAVNAPLTTPGQRGYWTFTGTQNQRVSAVIDTSTITSCAVIYNVFKIVSGPTPNGTIVGSTGGVCGGAIVEPVTLPSDGVYTVAVDPASSWTGQVAVTTHNVVDVTGPMTFGQTVSGPLTTPGQRGYWTFTGTQNQRVSAVINTSTVTNCAVIYHKFKIVSGTNPDGAAVVSVGGMCAGTMVGPVTLPADGTYMVVVDPSGSATGHVDLTAYSSSTLPAGWLTQDVGSVGVTGLASYANGVFTVQGSGQQIWNTADGLHYVYQSLSGDGTIVARVASLTGGGSTQSAGVMIRETLDANSKHAYAAFSQAQIYFTNRATTGGSTSAQSVTGTLPYWVKLTRSGTTFTASASADGVSWVQIGVPQTISMTAAVYIGLAVSSGDNSRLATATFDNVSP